jgi:hypothetical protein
MVVTAPIYSLNNLEEISNGLYLNRFGEFILGFLDLNALYFIYLFDIFIY